MSDAPGVPDGRGAHTSWAIAVEVLTKRYGRLFLDSLPNCTSRVGPLSELPKLAKQWLNL